MAAKWVRTTHRARGRSYGFKFSAIYPGAYIWLAFGELRVVFERVPA